MVDIDDVRRVAHALPRTEEYVLRDRVKFRVGRIVYAALSRDETILGFGFPKELRDGVIAAEPEKFLRPATADLRYNWLLARLDALDPAELRELLVEAWALCVSKRAAAEYFAALDQTG